MGLVASFRLPLVIGKERERERERERVRRKIDRNEKEDFDSSIRVRLGWSVS